MPLLIVVLLLAWAVAVCSARRANVMQSTTVEQGRKNREVDMAVVDRVSKRVSRRYGDETEAAAEDVEEDM